MLSQVYWLGVVIYFFQSSCEGLNDGFDVNAYRSDEPKKELWIVD